MTPSVKAKVVFLAAGIMSLAMGAIIASDAYVFTKAYARALQARSLAIGKGLTLQLDRLHHLGLSLENLIGFDEQCRDAVAENEGLAYAMVTDLDGRVLFHNEPSERGRTTTDASVLRAIRSGKPGVVVLADRDAAVHDAVLPVFDANGRHVAAVRIGVPSILITGKTKRMALHAAAVGLIFLGLSVLLQYVSIGSLVTTPLAKLLAVIEEMRSKGTIFTGKVPIDSDDEIGRLASAFNRMTGDLEKSTFTARELELTVEDVTRQLTDAQEELVRQEKLAMLGQLAGSVGHELRNPLGVINNAVYYLKTVIPDPDETLREYLDIIKTEVDNSQRIIADLLDFSRTGTPRAQNVSVSDLVQGGLEKCACPEGVAVHVDVPEGLPRVEVDPFQMGQVFQNLIMNAMQAMPGGGEVRVSARVTADVGRGMRDDRRGTSEAKAFSSLVPVSEANGHPSSIEISVADTGPGVAPENMKMLFQPLFTTKAKGVGLGLVVSKRLAEANGCRIEAESVPGKGTVFTVQIPAKARSDA